MAVDLSVRPSVCLWPKFWTMSRRRCRIRKVRIIHANRMQMWCSQAHVRKRYIFFFCESVMTTLKTEIIFKYIYFFICIIFSRCIFLNKLGNHHKKLKFSLGMSTIANKKRWTLVAKRPIAKREILHRQLFCHLSQTDGAVYI